LFGDGIGTFSSVSSISVGGAPASAAVGDFDQDGKLDLAVTDHNDGAVAVLSGNGDGTFRTTRYPVGGGAFGVTLADFDGDGALDLAATSYLDNGALTVLLNDGNGTFPTTGGASYAVGDAPYEVTSADFNGDGRPDLAVTDQGSYDLTVLLNNGDGTFPTTGGPASYAGDFPAGVTSADFNGDGKPDLAVADNDFFDVNVLLNNGDGTFPESSSGYFVGPYPSDVVSADLNGDGIPDLAVTDQDELSVLIGVGDGTFESGVDYAVPGSPTSLTAVDFNRDGKPDLAIVNSDEDTVSLFLNSGCSD
jgi:hypothetical protein